MIEKYDIEYMGVKCTGVDWAHSVNDVFYFTKDGQNYTYMQTEYISSSADTDHIRCVIEEQFLPWWKDQRIKKLEAENAELQARLDKSVELKDPYYVVDHDSGMIRLYYENVVRYGELYEDLEEAESRLAKLKGEQQ